MGEDAPEFAHSPDGQILELEVVVAKLKPVERGVPKVQPGGPDLLGRRPFSSIRFIFSISNS